MLVVDGRVESPEQIAAHLPFSPAPSESPAGMRTRPGRCDVRVLKHLPAMIGAPSSRNPRAALGSTVWRRCALDRVNQNRNLHHQRRSRLRVRALEVVPPSARANRHIDAIVPALHRSRWPPRRPPGVCRLRPPPPPPRPAVPFASARRSPSFGNRPHPRARSSRHRIGSPLRVDQCYGLFVEALRSYSSWTPIESGSQRRERGNGCGRRVAADELG
jgi:hypothetical protein